MEQLLDSKADVNGQDWKGRTPLLVAAAQGHVRMVTFLLDARAEPMLSADPDGWTPLHEAAYCGRPGVCDTLLEELPEKQGLLEARVQRHHQFPKATAALVASAKGHIDCLQIMIDQRASLDARDKDGNTPLMLAAADGNIEVCRMLVRNGCLLCGGPGSVQRQSEIDAGRPLAGCRRRCQDHLHVCLRNRRWESAAQIARHNLRQHHRFVETALFLESRGVR